MFSTLCAEITPMTQINANNLVSLIAHFIKDMHEVNLEDKSEKISILAILSDD